MNRTVPRQNDLPVTAGMLHAFKDELFARLDERFAKVDARFEQGDSRFEQVKAQISNLNAKVHHMTFLLEEQRQQNIVAIDGVRHALEELTGVKHRVDVLEQRTGISG